MKIIFVLGSCNSHFMRTGRTALWVNDKPVLLTDDIPIGQGCYPKSADKSLLIINFLVFQKDRGKTALIIRLFFLA